MAEDVSHQKPRPNRSQSETSEAQKGPRLPPRTLSLQGKRPPRLPLKKEVAPNPEVNHARDDPESSRHPIVEQEERELKIKAGMGALKLSSDKYIIKMDDMEGVTKLGSGITGEVYKMKHKPSGTQMAAKKMLWQQDSMQEKRRVLMDLEVMNSHHSPYIVEHYGSAIVNNEVWVFMELMSTSLDRLLKKFKGPFPEDIICKMCVSIVKALNYLKTEHKIIHRDVKPSNILIDKKGNIKLCDFGISGRLVESKAFTRGAGCAAYMAPERINMSKASVDGYDVRADVWSLGITLVELATGTAPYSSRTFCSEFELLTHIVQAPPPLLDKDKFSPDFYNFVEQCLSKDVEKRPHYSQLLQHQLIKDYETSSVDIGKWFEDMVQTHGPP